MSDNDRAGLVFALLWQEYSLPAVVMVIFLSHVINLIVKWYWLLKDITKPTLKVELRFAIDLIKATTTFLAIRSSKAILNSIDTLILSKLAGELEVGLMVAAFQIMVPIGLVFQSTVLGVFPTMCKNYDGSFQRLRLISEQLLEVLLIIVIPTTIGIFFLADKFLLLLYGNEDFAAATPLLRIVVWILILRVFTQVLGVNLLATSQEKKTLRIFLVNAAITIVTAPILIIQFGVVGAVIGALGVRIIDFIQHYIPIKRMFGGLAIGKVMWKPIVGSAIMYLALIGLRDQNLFVSILGGGLVYLAVLIPLSLWSAGGFENLKSTYINPWIENSETVTESA